MAISMATKFLSTLAQIPLLLAISHEISPKIMKKQPLNIYGAFNLANLYPKKKEIRPRKNPRKLNQMIRATMVIELQLEVHECSKQKRRQGNLQRRSGLMGFSGKNYNHAKKQHKLRRTTTGSREGQDRNDSHDGGPKGVFRKTSETEASVSSLPDQFRCHPFLYYLFYIQCYEQLFGCLRIIHKLNPPGHIVVRVFSDQYTWDIWSSALLLYIRIYALHSAVKPLLEQFSIEQLCFEQLSHVRLLEQSNPKPFMDLGLLVLVYTYLTQVPTNGMLYERTSIPEFYVKSLDNTGFSFEKISFKQFPIEQVTKLYSIDLKLYKMVVMHLVYSYKLNSRWLKFSMFLKQSISGHSISKNCILNSLFTYIHYSDPVLCYGRAIREQHIDIEPLEQTEPEPTKVEKTSIGGFPMNNMPSMVLESYTKASMNKSNIDPLNNSMEQGKNEGSVYEISNIFPILLLFNEKEGTAIHGCKV